MIDLEQESFSFDASLYDSKLLAFTLSGDMAVRLYWGDDAKSAADRRWFPSGVPAAADESAGAAPRPSPVSGDGDQVLMNETPPFRGISSASRFRMR